MQTTLVQTFAVSGRASHVRPTLRVIASLGPALVSQATHRARFGRKAAHVAPQATSQRKEDELLAVKDSNSKASSCSLRLFVLKSTTALTLCSD